MSRNPLLPALVLVLIVLLTIAIPLHAQAMDPFPVSTNICTGEESQLPANFADVVATPYLCAPIPGASATGPTVRLNSLGATAWWYCKRPTGKWVLQMAVAPAVGASVPTGAELWAAATSADTTAATNALARKYVSKPITATELKAAWCPHFPEMLAGTPPPDAPPAPGTWKAASSLAYTVRNGALGGLAGFLKPGTTCDCTSPTVVGTRTYCTYAGAPTPQAVAVCTTQ